MNDLQFDDEIPSENMTPGRQTLVDSVVRFSAGRLSERQARYLLLAIVAIGFTMILFVLIPLLTPESQLPNGYVTPPPGMPPGWTPPGWVPPR